MPPRHCCALKRFCANWPRPRNFRLETSATQAHLARAAKAESSMAKMMRAARYFQHGGPEVISVDHVPVPEPDKGQVLVEIAAAGVAPLDWKMRAGLLQQYFSL